MPPNQDDLYQTLTTWARAQKINSYLALSNEYQQLTGDWFEPHGSWDVPLGELNPHLDATIQAPALSALVVLAETLEPGGGFWGSAKNVPARQKSASARLTTLINRPIPFRIGTK